jgi:MraZ protein
VNRSAFANTEDVSFDASGRFIMPKLSRVAAQIADWVLFLGTADDFEMWNPHILIATDNVASDIRELAHFALTERGVAI